MQKNLTRAALAATFALTLSHATFAADVPAPQGDKLAMDIQSCSSGSTPEMRIAGCSAAISSGQLDPGNAARALNNRGNAYLASGQIDRAIADYTNAIQIAPSAVGYFNRGNAYLKKEQYDLAEKDYDAALKLDPNLADAYLNRGVTFTNRGQYDRAIADYNEVMRLRPNFATAFVKRGTAYFGKGDLTKAIADYDEALRLEPTNTQAAEMKKRAHDAQKGKH